MILIYQSNQWFILSDNPSKMFSEQWYCHGRHDTSRNISSSQKHGREEINQSIHKGGPGPKKKKKKKKKKERNVTE